MQFLDALGPAQRAVLEQHAHIVQLLRGQYLIRRGEPGGDVYLLRAGTLEAVDARSGPDVVLNVIEPGGVVGEMSFLDASPRSVDVRAGADAVVLRWPRDELQALLVRHPDIASSFYEGAAKLAVARVRNLTEGAALGGFGSRDTVGGSDAEQARAGVERLVDRVKVAMPQHELALHRDPHDATAIDGVREVLDRAEADLDALFEAIGDPASRNTAAAQLRRELHPYLLRSALAERALRAPDGNAACPSVLSHALVGVEVGNGRLGEVIDRWLLDRPSLRALRDTRETLVSIVTPSLPRHRNRRVLMITAGTGSLVAGLAERSPSPPTLVSVLDQREDALGIVRGDRWRGVEVRTIHESLTSFAIGQTAVLLPPQDAVFVHGILEYLPERMAVSLLRTVSKVLSEDGVVALSTLAPSRDQALLDRLLGWPMVRRTDEAILGLVRAAGFVPAARPSLADPARVLLLLPHRPQ